MEYMPDFQVVKPQNLDEALAAVDTTPGARFLAGGTDLVPNIRRGIVAPELLIDLGGLAELDGIEPVGGGLRIGAGVTLARLADDPVVAEHYPALSQAAVEVAASSHREVATLGGNLCLDTRCVFYNQSEWWRGANDYCLKYRGEICHVAPSGNHCFAAFSGDVAPACLVYCAEAEIAGPVGRRRLPLREIYADDGMAHLKLAPGEILVSVTLRAAKGWRSGYRKARVRAAIDFPLAGVAIALRRDDTGLAGLRVALTGTNSCPLPLAGTDDLLGAPLDDAAEAKLLRLLSKQIQPMTSTFTPPGYRRKVITNLTRALVRELYGDG